MSEKTEAPTPRRLKKAREDGDSPVSAALIQAVGFIAVVAMLPWFIAAAADSFQGLLTSALDGSAGVGTEALWEVVWLTLPIVGVAAAAALAAGLVQTGGVFAAKRISPELSRLSPATGLGALFSGQRAISVFRALAAAVVVAWICWEVLPAGAKPLAATVGNASGAATAGGSLALTLLRVAAGVGLALAALDVVVTRFSWKKRLRMSRDEVKRERKEAEGAPELNQARERVGREALFGASVETLRDATVLVVDDSRLATALKYKGEGGGAPEVIAHGRGELATLMREGARAYGVPAVRDVAVARALMTVEVGDAIPEAVYESVAEILREAWSASDVGPTETRSVNTSAE